MARVYRNFVEVDGVQIHYRSAGAHHRNAAARPLMVYHPSPTSSKVLEPLIAQLGEHRHVIAPDMPGNGDSEPLPNLDAPSIFDLAAHAAKTLDALALASCDLYGSHTGASIAMEVAIARPDRVGRLIIDGMGLYTSDEQKAILESYAPQINPDLNGSQLNWAWHFCRDQYLFWPWFARDREHARAVGLPSADFMHDKVVEVLKAIRTYHRSYRAAFHHPKRERLPLVRVPTLVTWEPSDMLAPYMPDVAKLVAGSRCEAHAGFGAKHLDATAGLFEAFLNGG